MKKHIITLVVATTTVIHSQAADLATQLLGYWKADSANTLIAAQKANRKLDALQVAVLDSLVFEFQKDKMTSHGSQKPNHEYVSYTIKATDENAKSLVLKSEEKEIKAKFTNGNLELKEGTEEGWTIYSPISKEEFTSLYADEEEAEEEAVNAEPIEEIATQPIPDQPASGLVHGRKLKVEEATLDLEDGSLTIGQGDGFLNKLEEFEIEFPRQIIKDFVGKPFTVEDFSGKTFTVEPSENTNIDVTLAYKVHGEFTIKTRTFLRGFSMRLEFGDQKDAKIPGEIHLRVPDTKRSFVVGSFVAEVK